MAYLSKISAIVSVNTGDARRQLSGFSGDTKAWATQFENTLKGLNNSASQSFAGIWTEAQQMQRLLKAALADGVDTSTIIKTGGFQKLKAEFEKIAALRKQASSFTPAGQDYANVQVDQLANAFDKLHERLVTTGRLSKSALADLQAMIAGATAGFKQISVADARLAGASGIADRFGKLGTQKFFDERALQGAVNQLNAFRTMMARVGGESGKTMAVFQRLVSLQEKAAAAGAKGQQLYQKELNDTQNELIELIALLGKAKNVSDLKTVGSVKGQINAASGGVANQYGQTISLGLQQAVYAIDDFNSATGGLDQKIRAAGNNISQLGVILGGTTGLIVGVLASITAQAYASYLKQADAANDTAAKTAYLTDREDRLKKAREQQSAVIDRILSDIKTAGLSEGQQRELSVSKEAEDLIKNARDAATTRLERSDPELLQLGARIEQIQKKLGESTDASQIRDLSSQLAQAQSQFDSRRETLLSGNATIDSQGLLDDFVNEIKRLRVEVTRDEDRGTNIRVDQLQNAEQAIERILEQLGSDPALTGQAREDFILDELSRIRSVDGAPNTTNAISDTAANFLSTREQRQGLQTAIDQASGIAPIRAFEEQLNNAFSAIQDAYGDLEIPANVTESLGRLNQVLNNAGQTLQDQPERINELVNNLGRLGVQVADWTDEAVEAGRAAARAAEEEKKLIAERKRAAEQAVKDAQIAKEFYLDNNATGGVKKALEELRKFSTGGAQVGVGGGVLKEETRTFLFERFGTAEAAGVDLSPRRARMDLVDVSDPAGAAEITRLLRGEDSGSNDPNLKESQKQTELLKAILEAAQNEGLI